MSPVLRPASPGVVYTPAAVAAPMVRRALEPLLRGSANELLALRVCDPAIGEGAFLVEALAILAEAVHAAWRREGSRGSLADARREAARCLAGCDIDSNAVATAREALGEGAQVIAGDALALDWHAAFPEVFARGGFDAVVGNPPYIRQERFAAQKASLAGFASYDGVADLYVYFIELAHRLVRRGGRYCLITPNKWLTAAYGRALRGFLAKAGSVEGVIDLGRSPLFAEDAFPCIAWGTVGEPSAQPILAARTTREVEHALATGVPHARGRWQAEPWHIDEPRDRALIDRLERTCTPLGAVIDERFARGVVTGCNRAFVIDRVTRDQLIAQDPTSAELIRPFAKGRDLRRWRTEPIARWILLVDRGTEIARYPAIEAHLARFRDELEPRPRGHAGPGRKPGSYRWFELQDPVGALAASRAPRLLYQDIQTQPACALDRSGDLVPDTTVWILGSADLYLLAVLNSSLYGWFAKRRFPPALNGAVRPKLEYMRAFPVAAPPSARRTEIEALVIRQLAGEALDTAIDDAVLATYELSRAELS